MATIQAVDRTFEILELLAAEPKGLYIFNLVAKTGLNKSTIHRILTTLSEWGYVEQNKDKSYKMGSKVLTLSTMYLNNLQLRTEATPYLEELRDKTQLTVHLGILEEEEIVYIDKLNYSIHIRMYSKIGKHINPVITGLGKAMLAYMDKRDVQSIVQKNSAVIREKWSSESDFNNLLKKVREQEYAFDDEENEAGIRCVAAPIFDYTNQVIAAVSVTGYLEYIPYEKVAEIAESVIQCAKQISWRMGHRE